jgi:TRAP-type mannitol/chloroaromatic compound transport system permease large subunit
VATPTEAAGMGASGRGNPGIVQPQTDLAGNQRQLPYATLKTTSMVMMLFIGGKFFSSRCF